VAVRLEDELKAVECALDVEAFRKTVIGLFTEMYPRWSDEDLLCLPREATRFCNMVRMRSGCDVADRTILRSLQNSRKAGRMDGLPRKVRGGSSLLADELAAAGCDLDPEAFREMLVDLLHGMYRSWTDEELTCNPHESLRYCSEVRLRARAAELSDMLILRSLTNIRRRSKSAVSVD
jgi:hypothetical protein